MRLGKLEIATRPNGSPSDRSGCEKNALSAALTRRRFLASGVSFGLAAMLAACGGDEATPTATPETSWQFTDDIGVTVNLPRRPERIVCSVNMASSLWDLGIRPIAIFGSFERTDGTNEPKLGDVDVSQVELLTEGWGELDLEKLATLDPDLIITHTFVGEPILAMADVETVTAICPVATVSFVERTALELIARIEELAGALGADLSSDLVKSAHTDFEQASNDLKSAIAEKPDLIAMFVVGYIGDNLYVGNSRTFTQLAYYKDLGLNIVPQDIPLDSNWETLSWEQANKYQVDLVFQDHRGEPDNAPNSLLAIPTWAAQPAVKAGQVGNWDTDFVASRRAFVSYLEYMTETINSADEDIV